MRRAADQTAVLTESHDTPGGWHWATYTFESCGHTRTEQFRPEVAPPKTRCLNCYECRRRERD